MTIERNADRTREQPGKTCDNQNPERTKDDGSARGGGKSEQDLAELRVTVEALRQSNQALSEAIEQLKAVQERLVESERMAAVGRVAAGIAHEISNQLSVLSYAELIRDRYPDDGEIRLFTAAILSARSRLGGLVGEIRDFSRVHAAAGEVPTGGTPTGGAPKFHLVEEQVALSVLEALSILRFDPAFRLRSIERMLDCPATSLVHRDKLVQVLVNLLRNAIDATPTGGEIQVRLTADEKHVKVAIEDHGAGIPTEVLPRIFDPFFSTKGDRGTGLGLGICRSIVSQHRGELTVTSPIPGGSGGTLASVVLPRVS